MDYIIIVFAYLISIVAAYLIIKKDVALCYNVLCNIVLLLVSFILILITGIQETSLLIHTILFILTLLVFFMRIITPLVSNFIGKVSSYFTK